LFFKTSLFFPTKTVTETLRQRWLETIELEKRDLFDNIPQIDTIILKSSDAEDSAGSIQRIDLIRLSGLKESASDSRS